jgi:hypothetical protein
LSRISPISVNALTLMDLCSAVEPKVDVDEKARGDENRDRRIAEDRMRVFLRRKLFLLERPLDHVPRRQL